MSHLDFVLEIHFILLISHADGGIHSSPSFVRKSGIVLWKVNQFIEGAMVQILVFRSNFVQL